MKRKLSTSSVADRRTPEFVVPRVRVRNGSCVVPKVRVRPHHVETKLLGITALSDLHVASGFCAPPSEVVDVVVESPHPHSADDGYPVSESSNRSVVTFAEPPVSTSPAVSCSAGSRRRLRPRRSVLRGSREKGSISPEREKNSDHVWYS